MAQANTRLAGLEVTGRVLEKTTATTVTTAGAGTYSAAAVVGGLILRDPAGGDRTDTTGTASEIMAEMNADNQGVSVGSSFVFTVRNTADAAETITVAGGTGVTVSGTATIAQNNQKSFLAVVTSATAITIYSLGTVVF